MVPNKVYKANWEQMLITADLDGLSAVKKLDELGSRILLIVDSQMHLLGVLTDGDVRRYFLKHTEFNVPVEKMMKKNPIIASSSDSREKMLLKMQKMGILHLPIVDEENRVVGIENLHELSSNEVKKNWVVFMAGGMGKRLRPLTLDCPKPLLKIGNKPILEVLLENFIKDGFRKFYFSVNYKSDMIQAYFGNGENWGVQIEYIEEKVVLGTAGALSLLPKIPEQPFFVVNADILTNINFGTILDFHSNNHHNPYATACVRQHESTIPYGVVQIHENHQGVTDIEEKPTRKFFVNAGIYLLNPDALENLVYNQYCDMPNFLLELVKKNLHVATFPIREYWLDIGQHDNLMRASEDYENVFER